jgi:asparagine synthase (glutamine-hydrolysing)
MCGLVVVARGRGDRAERLDAMAASTSLAHRGPDDDGIWEDPAHAVVLAHRRLSIIDRSDAGHQPMVSRDGRFVLVFNGEIYNYVELRDQLVGHPYLGHSDTEVLLAAYERWGTACLDRLLGMFAFVIYDTRDRRLFAARDRFGVKPLYYARRPGGGLVLGSEIKALHALGVPRRPDETAWARYLVHGDQDRGESTFWAGIARLPAGHQLEWTGDEPSIASWYDLGAVVGHADERPDGEVYDEYRSLLEQSVRLRFRSDVPVGVNLSGGVDSSTLLAMLDATGRHDGVEVFTFITGDDRYDELPWVERMLAHTGHRLHACRLDAEDVPELARSVAWYQDEPFGGVPTLAYARLFERARVAGVTVLLDGQGLDEQWAGYDYYWAAAADEPVAIVQGSGSSSPFRPDCLTDDFRRLATPSRSAARADDVHPDRVIATQLRDVTETKLPRALRYNDRASMRSGCELREPFLDHRLVELAVRQPVHRKLRDGRTKAGLRDIVAPLLPASITEAPKRALQTPQREWLTGPLMPWVRDQVDRLSSGMASGWFDTSAVRLAAAHAQEHGVENSYFLWQWLSVSLLDRGA